MNSSVRAFMRFKAGAKAAQISWWLIGCIMLGGCSVMQQSERSINLPADATLVVLPFRNLAQTPQAGQKIAAITGALLRVRDYNVVESPQSQQSPSLTSDLLSDDDALIEDAMNWARNQGAQYAVSGSIDEWRYKAGLDGEPAVGVTLNIIELETGKVVWTTTGARTGWGREGVAMAARTLLSDLLNDLPFNQP